MLKGALVLIWELDMNLEPTLLIMSEYTYFLIKLSKQALVSGGRCVDDVVLLLVDKQALKPKFAIPWKIY